MGTKMAPRESYVGQLGAQEGELGNILGGILAHLSRLGTNFEENDEKTKKL